MAAIAGILNHPMATTQALAGTGVNADAASGATSSSSGSSSSAATISSSDFLTLLVTELQNQDPTADTDPNEYVNQLVSVNSLEQLININSTLTADLGSSASTATSGTSSGTTADSSVGLTGKSLTGTAAQLHAAHQAGSPMAAQPEGGSSISSAIQTAKSKFAPGNLGIPDANSAAQTVAQALSGHRFTP